MYPPEPWSLRGRLYLSAFAVPRSALSTAAARPVPLGPRALVGVAWVRYEPGGVLHYQELLSAVLVHDRGRPRVSITEIWVDSTASRDGGRELWAIPKELADLTIRTGPGGGTVAAAIRPGPGDLSAPIGSASFRPGIGLPGRWPLRLTLVQALEGRLRRTPVRGRAGVRLGGSTWRMNARGPLGYLAGRRPLVTLTIADFRMTFGARQLPGPGTRASGFSA
jgi:hypothetical protein